jgi:hypothetical protein
MMEAGISRHDVNPGSEVVIRYNARPEGAQMETA